MPAAPALTDLVFYTNKPLTATDWSTNFTALINYLTTTYNVTFNNVTINGTLTYEGDLNFGSSTITADAFVGDGSGLTGLNINNKNWLANGGMQIDLIQSDQTLVKDTYLERVDSWDGMATGTAVSAGTITKILDSTIGTTGYALKFNNVTLTGSGIIYLRQRIGSTDAKKLIGQTVSVQALVAHDCGVSINYVITLRKADALDDFTTCTAIGNSGNIAKTTGTGGQIKYEGLAMGACGNGVELEIKCSPGAITAKDFEFTEIQLEISPTITDFEQINYYSDYIKTNPTATKWYSVNPADFIPTGTTATWLISTSVIGGALLLQSSGTGQIAGNFSVHLPVNAVVTSFSVYWYRDDASADGTCLLLRHTLATGDSATMATANSDATSGNHTVTTTSISNATIDTSTYSYSIALVMNPNNNLNDVKFYNAVIAYTIGQPIE